MCHDSLFCKNLRRKDKQWEYDKDKNYQTPGQTHDEPELSVKYACAQSGYHV